MPSIVRQTDRQTPVLLYGSVQWATRELVEDRGDTECNWVKLRNWSISKYRHSYIAHRQTTQQHIQQIISTTPPLRKLQQIQGGRRRVLLALQALLSQAASDCHSVQGGTLIEQQLLNFYRGGWAWGSGKGVRQVYRNGYLLQACTYTCGCSWRDN